MRGRQSLLMLTLALLRHAKSSWDDPGIDDFARPLADRGRIAAPLMGEYLVRHRLQPDLIICSAALRTRATLDLVLPFFGPVPPAIAYEESLYLASASDLLSRLRSVASRWPSVMLIGHNPGFHDLAVALAATGDPQALATLSVKFPTAALATLTFQTSNWANVRPGLGHLTHFVTPSSLQKGRASA